MEKIPTKTKKLSPTSQRAKKDSLGPPEQSVLCKCWHCGEQYQSSKMFYGHKEGIVTLNNTPLWWCPTEDCDGAGFRFDIHPVENDR